MAIGKPPATTLLRSIVIAAATVAIGIIVITFVFLSSGNESELLPPWQLVLAEATCVAALLLLSRSTLKFKNDSSVFSAAAAISGILTLVVAVYFGFGHTWSLIGVVGQTIALYLMLAYPILITAGVIVIMRRRSARMATTWAVSMVLCLLLTVPMLAIGLVLACATGDCL